MLGIIIPTYDSVDTLEVLLRNIANNTDGDYRVYVIEDGQKKDTISFLKKQRGIKVIWHKENKGVSTSWNDGIRSAQKDRCKYFAILNDDIEVPKRWNTDCLKMFGNDVHMVSLPTKVHSFSGWFFIIDQICVDKIGYFDEQFSPYCSEDDDYMERFRQSGLRRATVDIKVFHHGSRTLNKIDRAKFMGVTHENWQKFRKKYYQKTMTAYSRYN